MLKLPLQDFIIGSSLFTELQPSALSRDQAGAWSRDQGMLALGKLRCSEASDSRGGKHVCESLPDRNIEKREGTFVPKSKSGTAGLFIP